MYILFKNLTQVNYSLSTNPKISILQHLTHRRLFKTTKNRKHGILITGLRASYKSLFSKNSRTTTAAAPRAALFLSYGRKTNSV